MGGLQRVAALSGELQALQRSAVRDIVGLYLSPPDRALVLCVDEKARSRHSIAHSRF